MKVYANLRSSGINSKSSPPIAINVDNPNQVTTRQLKEQIQRFLGIPPSYQRVIFCGSVLADEVTLAQSKITDGDAVNVFVSSSISTSSVPTPTRGTPLLEALLQIQAETRQATSSPGSPTLPSSSSPSATSASAPSLPSCAEVASGALMPLVLALEPDTGLTSGGAKVLIVGANFRPASTVRFGPVFLNAIFHTENVLQVVSPPHPVGAVSVQVYNPTSSPSSSTSSISISDSSSDNNNTTTQPLPSPSSSSSASLTSPPSSQSFPSASLSASSSVGSSQSHQTTESTNATTTKPTGTATASTSSSSISEETNLTPTTTTTTTITNNSVLAGRWSNSDVLFHYIENERKDVLVGVRANYCNSEKTKVDGLFGLGASSLDFKRDDDGLA
jgi:hypothetical protein